MDRQKDRKTERQKDKKTERQKDRKTERQKDRKTERQKDRKTERQKDRKVAGLRSCLLHQVTPYKIIYFEYIIAQYVSFEFTLKI